jgi:hypothetical protein
MTSLRAQFTRELTIRGRAARTIQGYLACLASLAKHYGRPPDRIGDEEIRANHARKREIPKARAAIARQRRRVCNVLRDKPPPKSAAWQPACPRCGGTQMFCVALLQPDGRTIVLPAAARLSPLRPRAPP